MIQIFHLIFYQPLLNLLVIFYNSIAFGDLGLAIIFLTLLIKLIFYPLSHLSIKAQKALTDLQPKLTALKEKFAQDKEKLARATMELYRENKINPFASCLPILVQLPIFIAIYQVLIAGLADKELVLYSFVSHPGHLNSLAFGFLDLSKPNVILAFITGLLQYWQIKMFSQKKPPVDLQKKGGKDENLMVMMNKQMMVMMPILTVIIGISLPSGLIFYWLISLVLTILQQMIFFKKS